MALEQRLELPVFEGSQMEKVSQILDWIGKNIEKRRWTDEEIEEKFAKRSAVEILNDGHTCYMNPCGDYTFVTAEILKRNGFDVTLVIEELKRPHKEYAEIHFAIELSMDGEHYFIEYVTLDDARFEKGLFVDRFGDKYITGEKIRVDGSRLNPFEHPFRALGITYEEDLPKAFRSYSLRPHLEQLKKDNTDGTYEKFLRERKR